MRLSILLFVATAIAATGCAGTLESSLDHAHDARRPPPDLRVVYDDHTELAGGDRIEVAGGTLRWWKQRPGFVEASSAAPESMLGANRLGTTPDEPPTIEIALPAEALLALVEVLRVIEPWDQDASSDPSRLDQRRAILDVEVHDGRESTWEWRDALEGNDVRLARFRAWAAEASGERATARADATPSESRPASPTVPGDDETAPATPR